MTLQMSNLLRQILAGPERRLEKTPFFRDAARMFAVRIYLENN